MTKKTIFRILKIVWVVVLLLLLSRFVYSFIWGKEVPQAQEQTGTITWEVVEPVYVPTLQTLTVTFPDYPVLPGGYQANTTAMNRRLSENMQTIEIPADLMTWNISFVLTKPLTAWAVIVRTNVYINKRGVRGRLDTEKAVVSWSTYTFDLSNLPVRYNSKDIGGDILGQVRGKTLLIWAYCWENKNKVENINIQFYK